MRIQTNALGQEEERCYSYPFGDGLTCTGPAADATEHHFTGKERDAESGLDYFGARYLSSNLGRFMTPDWAAGPITVPYASFGDPQSLNLYAYVGNNPLTGIDLDGHDGQFGSNFQDASQNNNGIDMTSAQQETEAAGQQAAQEAAGNSGSSGSTSGTPPPPAPKEHPVKDPTPPSVDPRTQAALLVALGILNGDNTCSAFFNAAIGGSAAAMLSTENIKFTTTDPTSGETLSPGIAAVSYQGAGADSTIFINSNGGFLNSTAIVGGKSIPLRIGGYSGGSLRAQVLDTFHEFGHQTNAIRTDGGTHPQTTPGANTQTILDHCAKQIEQNVH